MRTTRRAALVGTASLTLALLAGCSSSQGSDDPAPSAEGSTETQQGPDEKAEGDGTGSGVGVDAVETKDVLAEQTYTLAGTDDQVTVGVHSLVVDGDIMTLKLVLTPDFASVSADEPVSLYEMVGTDAMWERPVIFDRDNLKEYTSVTSSDFHQTEAASGDPVVWWGIYAAPEDDIDTVSVRFMDTVPEFTDVPVTR
ncbi:hypothetical protein [Georgenia sp. SYP-B2076]|uniref:hypothetical protein n=1 Tax=Georgenia sp. SYP-B2076 TaxID=2495881 RepID=UPI000F8E78FB|nr:hypothetical protein [Georgenia sp. SYP-B2076]